MSEDLTSIRSQKEALNLTSDEKICAERERNDQLLREKDRQVKIEMSDVQRKYDDKVRDFEENSSYVLIVVDERVGETDRNSEK